VTFLGSLALRAAGGFCEYRVRLGKSLPLRPTRNRLVENRRAWSRIEERIQEADERIRARRHEFSLNHGETPEESQAIEDALNALNVLRKEVSAWQESKRAS
jgi:hypothetical protein